MSSLAVSAPLKKVTPPAASEPAAKKAKTTTKRSDKLTLRSLLIPNGPVSALLDKFTDWKSHEPLNSARNPMLTIFASNNEAHISDYATIYLSTVPRQYVVSYCSENEIILTSKFERIDFLFIVLRRLEVRARDERDNDDESCEYHVLFSERDDAESVTRFQGELGVVPNIAQSPSEATRSSFDIIGREKLGHWGFESFSGRGERSSLCSLLLRDRRHDLLLSNVFNTLAIQSEYSFNDLDNFVDDIVDVFIKFSNGDIRIPSTAERRSIVSVSK